VQDVRVVTPCAHVAVMARGGSTMARGRARAVRTAAGVLVAAIALALPAAPALAHAAFVASLPADGAEVVGAPDDVRFVFDAPVVPVGPGVRVFDASARRIDVGPLDTGDPRVVAARLPAEVAPGVLVAVYRVASEDGHVLQGSATFTVRPPAVEDAAPVEPPSRDELDRITSEVVTEVADPRGEAAVGVIAALLRTVTYVTALLALGAGIFALVVAREEAHRELAWRPVRPAALATIVASLVALPVQALIVVGLDRVPLMTVVADLAAVPSNRAVVLRLVGATVLLVLGRGLRAAPGAAMLLASFVIDGHQFDAEPNWLLRLADTIHLATAALWVGGVVVLAMVFAARRRDPVAMPTSSAAALVTRFSAFAVVSVAATLLSGVVMAGILVGSVQAATSSLYGRVFIAKLAFVGLVMAVAAYNRRTMVPLLEERGELAPEAEDRAWARLVTTVRGEALMLAGVLIVTGLLVAQEPPVAPGSGATTVVVTVDEGLELDVTLDPARVGRVTVHVYARETDGRASERATTAVLDVYAPPTPALPEGPPEPTDRLELAGAGVGHWIASTERFDRPGTWRVEVMVGLADGSVVTADLAIDVTRR
jgi:copper transport protein